MNATIQTLIENPYCGMVLGTTAMVVIVAVEFLAITKLEP